MITSFALIILIGLLLSKLCSIFKVPSLIGLIATGAILGPYILNYLSPDILQISPDLRLIALVLILLKAGLSLSFDNLKKIGKYAFFLSFVPASCEIVGYSIFGPLLLGLKFDEALLLGSIIAAVSPAVVVPRMVKLMDNEIGTKKGIPQMLLGGASCDDIFVIVMFSVFLHVNQTSQIDLLQFSLLPVTVLSSVLLGVVVGYMLHLLFEYSYKIGHYIRNSEKIMIILGVSFALIGVERLLHNTFSISGLLAMMTMAIALNVKTTSSVIERLKAKFSKLWLFAEILLFVLLGACINLEATVNIGLGAIAIIFIALIFRSFGVFLSLLTSNLNAKERLFCIISYIPKATVQAAIGGIPLALGLPCGNVLLSVAVLSIIITAPLGAFLSDLTYKKLLLPSSSK